MSTSSDALTGGVTFVSQQTRALNLIDALRQQGLLEDGSRIAVIGAGVAGVTTAVYAALHGGAVTVFERLERAFELQRGCNSRWLHPHIYDWPVSGWDNPRAELEVMSWEHGSVQNVLSKLDEQWQVHMRLRNIELVNYVWSMHFIKTRGDLQLQWNRRYGDKIYGGSQRTFDIFILCVGFGYEPEYLPFSSSYWRETDFGQSLGRPTLTLMSGCGDGGLIDAFRVSIRDFEHSWIKQLGQIAIDAGFANRLVEIEEDPRRYPDVELLEVYGSLKGTEKLDEAIRERLRPDSGLILNADRDSPFDRRSSLLNRFLVSRLFVLKCANFEPGRFDVRAIEVLPGTPPRYQVNIESLGRTKSETVDRIIIRHGPRKAPLEHDFREVWDEMSWVRNLYDRDLLASEQTRVRLEAGQSLRSTASVSSQVTTVRKPAVRPVLIPRDALLDKLDGLLETAKIINLYAPRGYGKSLLLFEYRERLRASMNRIDCLLPPISDRSEPAVMRLISERIGGSGVRRGPADDPWSAAERCRRTRAALRTKRRLPDR